MVNANITWRDHLSPAHGCKSPSELPKVYMSATTLIKQEASNTLHMRIPAETLKAQEEMVRW